MALRSFDEPSLEEGVAKLRVDAYPQFPETVLGLKGRETPLGYAVLVVPSAGRDGYIFDLTTLPARRDVARTLLRESVRLFRRAGVQIVRYRFYQSTSTPRSRDLRRLGFFHRKGRRNSLLVKFSDSSLHEAARDITRWSYTAGDGEGSFWTSERYTEDHGS